ncbi:MAG: response regulator [Lachnospiraceae bacterium]|nr:response regulator [Lachnospiraceae bacterium]
MELEIKKKEPPKILIVDDISVNLKVLEKIISAEGYEPLCALSVQEAIDIMNESLPQLILSDLSMPGMDGLEFCKLLKSNPRTRDIPFIFITVLNSGEEKEQAFLAGAVDFIPKPFERVEVVMRVNNQLSSYQLKQEMANYNRMMHKLVSEQQKQIEEERENLLFALAKVVEKRDTNTGRHLENVGYNSRILAQSLQLLPKFEEQITDDFIETIGAASKLHDIGNIVIPDKIFLKESSLDVWEMEVIKRHTEEGAKILEEIYNEKSTSKFLGMAITIARYHHANWDGTGYPENLAGEQIPLEARIVALTNTFDVLIGKRCYKDAYPLEESLKIINEESGTVFDPDIVEVFNKVWKQMRVEHA